MIYRTYFFIFSILFFSKSILAQNGELFPELNGYYKDYMDTKGVLPHVPNESRMGIYFNSFSYYGKNIDQSVGYILSSLIHQDNLIKKYVEAHKNGKTPEMEMVPAKVRHALRLAALEVRMSYKNDLSDEEFELYQKASQDFFTIYDLQGFDPPFSGLPFFEQVKLKLQNDEFRKNVKELEKRLVTLVNDFKKTDFILKDNLYQIAFDITGSSEKAIELLGISLGRDSGCSQYIRLVNVQDIDFALAFGRNPLLVRLIVELNKKRANTAMDSFSYNGEYQTPGIKNYYYWVAAYSAQAMWKKGHSAQNIMRTHLAFTLAYKHLRLVQYSLKEYGKNLIDQDWWVKFRSDTMSCMLGSGRGVNFTLNKKNWCPSYFNSFQLEAPPSTIEE